MKTTEKTYLGDGVYVRHTGHNLVLTTEDGIEVTNTIYLENEVYVSLVSFVERLKTQNDSPKMFIIRLWDMFDGWMDVSEPLTSDEADALWLKKTDNGTKNTQYSDGDYYKIFPADTKMVVDAEYLGR